MTRFFRFYEQKNNFDNIHHKAQFLATAFMPLLFILLSILTYLSMPVAIAAIVAFVSMYITGLFRSIVPALRKRTGIYSPLLVSSASGPIYLAALLLTDPSLTGITGLILVFAIPFILLVPLIIDVFRNDEFDEDEFDEEYLENSHTEEFEKIS